MPIYIKPDVTGEEGSGGSTAIYNARATPVFMEASQQADIVFTNQPNKIPSDQTDITVDGSTGEITLGPGAYVVSVCVAGSWEEASNVTEPTFIGLRIFTTMYAGRPSSGAMLDTNYGGGAVISATCSFVVEETHTFTIDVSNTSSETGFQIGTGSVLNIIKVA